RFQQAPSHPALASLPAIPAASRRAFASSLPTWRDPPASTALLATPASPPPVPTSPERLVRIQVATVPEEVGADLEFALLPVRAAARGALLGPAGPCSPHRRIRRTHRTPAGGPGDGDSHCVRGQPHHGTQAGQPGLRAAQLSQAPASAAGDRSLQFGKRVRG